MAGASPVPGPHVWLVCIGLAIGTLAVYAQVREFQFVLWDDHLFFSENWHARSGLSWENLVWSLKIHGPGQWHPLSWWVHQLNCELFGLEAGGHHLVNVLLHTAATLALLAAFWRLTGEFWPSALVAALFALHPLSVESVAWASHLRDPLSTLFWALVMWAYAGFARRGSARRYLLVLLLFALGLMAKPTLITLPCVLLLLDYWPLRRIAGFEGVLPLPVEGGAACPRQSLRRVLLEKVPLFVLSGISAWLCFLSQQSVGAVASLDAYPPGVRLANTAQSYVLHLWNIAWPAKLSHIYPFPTSFEMLPVAGAVVFLVLVSAGAVWFGRRRGYLLVGWLWFLGTLAPTIGLLKLGTETSMTDHHGYVPRLGIYVAIAWTLAGLVKRRPAARHAVVAGVAAVLLALLPLSWRQAGVWRDDLSLNEHALAVTKNNYLAHSGMGNALQGLGRPQEAIAQYQEALRIHPDYAEPHNNWGNALKEWDRYAEAIAHYQEALRIQPDYVKAHNNWGNALKELGRPQEAATHYQEALRIQPNYAEAQYNWAGTLLELGRSQEAISHYQEALRIQPYHAEAQYNWGGTLQQLGRPQEAISHYQEALRIQPDFAKAHSNWGSALQMLGQYQEAITHFEEALRIQPDYAKAHNNWGGALQMLGRHGEAAAHFEEALRIQPDYAKAHSNFGSVLRVLGRPQEAIAHFKEALRIQPDFANAHRILAWMMASSNEEGIRDGEQALGHARRFVELVGENDPIALDTLAAAHAELGNFDEAVSWQQRALRLARGTIKEEFIGRLELYRQGLPYRQPD